ELPDRLRPVLAVLYLVFNEGYAASSGPALVRDDLCAEAIRLARILAGLMPDEPEVLGLLALLLLAESRRPARAGRHGELVQLPGYHLFHSTRADLLRRLGRTAEAAQAYDAALALTENAAERAFLEQRRAEVAGTGR